jgi:hypothetical protein
MSESLPTGPFTCNVVLRRVRPPDFLREEKQGVTYLVARGYETAYETILRFTGGAQPSVKAKLIGELNQRVVVRDARGRPVRMSGYVQGLVEIGDAQGHVLFRGASTTPERCSLWPEMMHSHPPARVLWTNGRMVLVKAPTLTREGDAPLHGEGRGHVD